MKNWKPVKVRELTDPVEIETGFRRSYPNILYKYRRWDYEKHKESIETPAIWYTHPKSFNDEYDIRVPYEINYQEVFDSRFPARFAKFFQTKLIPGTRDYEISIENHVEEIRRDPQKWFDDNAYKLRNGPIYDVIGVFSLTNNPTNPTMWAYYANENTGFCIGYDPFEIFKLGRSHLHKVEYSEKGIEYSLLEDRDPWDFRDFYLKEEKWKHEEEYRFITFIEEESDRLQILSKRAIKQVVLGCKISSSDQMKIIELLKTRYDSKIELFKINLKLSGFGMTMKKIAY